MQEYTRKKDTLVASVVAQITQSIIEGEWRPGEKMPSELELMQRLQVCRSTLREGLKQLEARRVVDIRHGNGTFVCAEPLGLAFFPDAQKCRQELFEICLSLEPHLARLAARQSTPGQKQEMRRLCQIIYMVASESKAVEEYIQRFYILLGTCGDNRVMARMTMALHEHFPPLPPSIAGGLRDVAQAICEKNELQAAQAMTDFLTRWEHSTKCEMPTPPSVSNAVAGT